MQICYGRVAMASQVIRSVMVELEQPDSYICYGRVGMARQFDLLC